MQLDRLLPSPHGHIAERHGSLIAPGATTLELAPGYYFFQTLSVASLRVVRGGVDTSANTNDKDPWPDPPSRPTDVPPKPSMFGDDLPGEAPRLTVVSS